MSVEGVTIVEENENGRGSFGLVSLCILCELCSSGEDCELGCAIRVVTDRIREMVRLEASNEMEKT